MVVGVVLPRRHPFVVGDRDDLLQIEIHFGQECVARIEWMKSWKDDRGVPWTTLDLQIVPVRAAGRGADETTAVAEV